MSLSSLAQQQQIPVQALMQANRITNPNAMLMPGTQLLFPDAFGGSGLFGMLAHLLGLDGAMPMPPPGSAGGAPSQGAPAVAGGDDGAPSRPMRESKRRPFLSDPVGAVEDWVKQETGTPLDGDANKSSDDGLKDTGVKTPFVPKEQSSPPAGGQEQPPEKSPASQPPPTSGPTAPDGGRDVHVTTPHVTQWNSTACKLASDKVVAATGGQHDAVRINVATSRPGSGGGRNARVNIDPAKMKQGMDRINSELDKGHAVEVGLAHDNGGNHNDGITDHFVAITGRGTDAQGRRYYTFHDPAYAAGGDDNACSRFYVDPQTGGLYRPASSRLLGGSSFEHYRYEVTTVR
jgi:hypothetical protein